MALTEDGDYVLDSCSERDFNNHGCSKINELFLVVIDGWAGRSELICLDDLFLFIDSAIACDMICIISSILCDHAHFNWPHPPDRTLNACLFQRGCLVHHSSLLYFAHRRF